MAWTEKDLQKIKDKGFSIDGNKPFRREATILNPVPDILKSQRVKMTKISIEKNTIGFVLISLKQKGLITDFVTEHKFDNVRRFRFDWAIIDLKIAIEYEGIISEKSRHTSMDGFSNDCVKYNLAIANGWRVLRYTAINYQNLETDLLKIL